MSLLDQLKKIEEEYELRYPRKTTPSYFRLCQSTLDYIKGLIPVKKEDPRAAPLLPIWKLQGMEFRVDENVPELTVRVMNRDNEVIEDIYI